MASPYIPLTFYMVLERSVIKSNDNSPVESTLLQRHGFYVLPAYAHYYPRFYADSLLLVELLGSQPVGAIRASKVYVIYSKFAREIPFKLKFRASRKFFSEDYRALLKIPAPILGDITNGLPYLIRGALFELGVKGFQSFRLTFCPFIGEHSINYPINLGDIVLCSYDDDKMHVKLCSESAQLLPEFGIIWQAPRLFFRFPEIWELTPPSSCPTLPPSPLPSNR